MSMTWKDVPVVGAGRQQPADDGGGDRPNEALRFYERRFEAEQTGHPVPLTVNALVPRAFGYRHLQSCTAERLIILTG
jgi:hypothetical protein